MKKLFFSMLILALSTIVFSQTPEILAKSFMEDVKARGIETALKYAAKDSVMSIPSKIEKISQQYKNQRAKLGTYYGAEEVINDNKNKVECFVIKTYILKFENAPAQLNLVFYKPNDKWLLHNVVIKKFNNNRRNRN